MEKVFTELSLENSWQKFQIFNWISLLSTLSRLYFYMHIFLKQPDKMTCTSWPTIPNVRFSAFDSSNPIEIVVKVTTPGSCLIWLWHRPTTPIYELFERWKSIFQIFLSHFSNYDMLHAIHMIVNLVYWVYRSRCLKSENFSFKRFLFKFCMQ